MPDAQAVTVPAAEAVTPAGAEPVKAAETEVVAAAAGSAEATLAVSSRRKARTRNALVGALVVLVSLALLLSGVAWWTHYTVLNTDGYIGVVGPLADNPETIAALSEYVASEVIAATDLEARTSEALPEGLSFLAEPITGTVDAFIAEQTRQLLSTQEARDLWIDVNRVAHTQVVALLRGESTNAYIEGDQVKLNMLPFVSQVLVRIDSRLPGALGTRFDPPVIAPGTPPDEANMQLSEWLGRPLAEDAGQITILTSEALGPAQAAVKWLDRLVIILPILTVVLAAAAIWLSRHRRRTIIELGIGVAAALAIFYVVVERLSTMLADRLKTESLGVVVQDVVAAATGPLADMTVWIVVAGVIVAIVAWAVGRPEVTSAVTSAGNQAMRASSPALSWSARHADLLRVAGLVVGLALLMLFSWSWLWVIVWLALTAAFQVFVSWLAGAWPFAGGGRSSAAA